VVLASEVPIQDVPQRAKNISEKDRAMNTVLRSASVAVQPVRHEMDRQAPASAPARRVVFISHANPEDNPAASWFATKLTLLGYEVWCDLKNTHGGESDFWLKVQKMIENDAAKFVYILSNTSCDFERKKGIYKEVQTAENLRIDNFIIPVRIENLTRSLPILLATSLYINGKNWADGLRDLVDRLTEDGVPKRTDIDFEKISSWWPAISVEKIMCRDEEEELVSNILPIQALPANVHFIKVFSEGNLVAGLARLRKALPAQPAYYTHGDYIISFGNPFDFAERTHGLDFETAYVLGSTKFFSEGHDESGVAPEIARNIVTYLVGQAWDSFLASKNLSAKSMSRSNHSLWYMRDGVIPNNRVTITEPGKRKVPISLVGTVKHYRKKYRWHFGFLPSVDLRVHDGIVLSPKAVISLPYNAADGEVPVPIDDKKVLKALNWWNREWRQKLLAMLTWLSGDQSEIAIPAGYQQIVLSNLPQSRIAKRSFAEMSDDDVIDQAMESIVECAPAP
jgi:hypothetical protein